MKTTRFILLLIVSTLGIISNAFSQNPLWSLPSNYAINNGSNLTPPTPLPMPFGLNNTNWGIRYFPGSPIIPNPINPNNPNLNENVYDGRPASSVHNAGYDAEGKLAFFIIDEYVFDKDALH